MVDRFAAYLVAGAALAATLVVLPDTAQGQDDRRYDSPQATVYRDMGWNGPAVTLSGDRPDLGLNWQVNSIRVQSGRWQLCERTRYRGRCITVDRDEAMLGSPTRGMAIQSARPISGSGGGWGGGGGSWQQDAPANDQTARGMFAQFHTQPQRGGYRIRACTTGSATAACAARTADQFCRQSGWSGSAREHIETVGRTAYLADTLCVRSGS